MELLETLYYYVMSGVLIVFALSGIGMFLHWLFGGPKK